MIKLFSFSLLSLACFLFFVEPTKINAQTFRIISTTVEGNYRISDDAIVNYSRLDLNSVLSLEELNKAYTNILETGLFKKIEFIRNGSALKIFVEEYPTVNEISFEGNRRFTDDRLTSFLTLKPRYVVTSKSLEKDLEAIISRANVIDPRKLSGAIKFGATIRLIDEETELEKVFQIVGEPEADIEKNLLNMQAPLARALIGKEAGDSIEVKTPGGTKSYEIIEVKFI